MRISTTNYPDFCKLVEKIFGDGYSTFFGNKSSPHEKVVVMAIKGDVMVVYTSPYPLPESFNQEFVKANPLQDIGEIVWSS